MADTCTHLARLNGGRIGDVARGIGGTLVSPPLNVSDVQRYFGDVEKFPQVDDLLRVLQHGVPAETKQSQADFKTALGYGNHRTIQDHLPQIWGKLADDVRRNRCLVFKKRVAAELEHVRVASLGAVVTSKVRIINDFSFDPNTARCTKGGLNWDTLTQDIPRCLCGEALPKLLAETVRLRIKYPLKRILISKADVSDAFRNVRVAPEQANKFCYVLDDLIVADLRLTFGWAGSPGFWGLLSSAAEHAHCNTSVRDAHILSEGEDMMSHVTIVEPWEEGAPASVPRDTEARPSAGGGLLDPFFATVYVDDFILVRVQQDPSDQTALIASASLASDHVRLFGPGEEGEIPILSLKKSTNWDTTVDALGYTRENVAALRDLLEREWLSERAEASTQEVLSIAGKLSNLTFVVRAGRYFVWQLLRITDLHSSAAKSSRKRSIVQLGREFHGDLAFWKWTISRRLVQTGESLSAPFYAHSKCADICPTLALAPLVVTALS